VPLDEFLPGFDVNEIHSTRVAAPPEAVLAAARALTPRELPLLVVLMALRSVPALLGRRRPISLDEPILDRFLRAGFAVLAERQDELVVGGVGRFWRPDGGVRPTTAAEFAAFSDPGYARAAINFHAVAEPGGGTLLTTETRIAATDEGSRRSFRRYWRVIGPWSALIRRAWLRSIRRRAERSAPTLNPPQPS
jgi:hypothetical protein